jgi:hypothetical protein
MLSLAILGCVINILKLYGKVGMEPDVWHIKDMYTLISTCAPRCNVQTFTRMPVAASWAAYGMRWSFSPSPMSATSVILIPPTP